MTMADTVAVMNHGRIEQMGTPADLYELPRTAFVANFLGQSNLLAGHGDRAAPSDGLLASTSRGTRILVPAARARCRPTGDVLVGVRPGEVRLLRRRPGAPAGTRTCSARDVVTDVSLHRRQHAVPGARSPGLGTFGVFAQNLARRPDGRGRAPRSRLAGPSDFTFAPGRCGRPPTRARSTWTTSREHRVPRSATERRDAAAAAAAAAPPRRAPRRRTCVLLLPGLLCLVVFFVVPVVALFATSLYVPAGRRGRLYQPTLQWQNYVDAIAQFWPHVPALVLVTRSWPPWSRLRHRLPAGLRDRASSAGRSCCRTCCSSWSSRRSSPASSCGPSRGSRSWPTTARRELLHWLPPAPR